MTAQIFEQVKLESISEKGSYGIGLQIGQQLARSEERRVGKECRL